MKNPDNIKKEAADRISRSMEEKYGGKNTRTQVETQPRGGIPESRKVFADHVTMKMESRYDPSVEVNEYDVRTFLADAGSFLRSYEKDYDSMGYGNAESLYQSRRSAWESLTQRGEQLYELLQQNRDLLGEEGNKSFRKYLADFRNAATNQNLTFKQGVDYYSQWDSEEAYNKYAAQQKEYEEMRSFDVAEGQKEIARLENILTEYKDLTRWETDEKGRARAEEIRKQYGSESDIEALISQKNQYLTRASRLQEGEKLSSVGQEDSEYYAPDFGQLSAAQSDVEDVQYRYINDTEYRMEYQKLLGGSYDNFHEAGLDIMTEDEKGIYNYYYARDGKEKAQEYLNSIRETLNHRRATGIYEDLEDNTLLELAFGVAAGIDQFQGGMRSLLWNSEGEYVAPSAKQMASGMVREDLADVGVKLPEWMGGASFGQAGYDAITTTANMAPSIMTSMGMNILLPGSGAAVGTAMMGASAAGNAYQEMLNLGYDKKQARGYSLLVGSSEAILGYALSGISALGGKVTGNVLSKMLNGVDNAFLHVGAKILGNMASEGLEEGLQEILTPWFQNLMMHTGEDINWNEVAYSTLLGALTAGFMEGGGTVTQGAKDYRTGTQLQEKNISVGRLAEIGQTFAADTVAYQLAGRVNENTGAYTLGRMFNEIGATLTEQNISDITEALVQEGMAESMARKNAEAMAAVVEGATLTDTQRQIIEGNDVLARAARTTIFEENSTVYQRTKGYNDVLMELAQEMTAPDTSRTNPAQQGGENASVPGVVDSQNKNVAEGSYGASEDGKTILKSTGETVSINKIMSIKDGKMTLKLEDGRTVDAEEVTYSSKDWALIYETIANLGAPAAVGNIMIQDYQLSPNSDGQAYSKGMKDAYYYGAENYPVSVLGDGTFTSLLTERQRMHAYKMGKAFGNKQAAATETTVKEALNSKNSTAKKSIRRRGRVKGYGIQIDDLNKAFNPTQKKAYRILDTIAEVTGIDIVLYKSRVDKDGNLVGGIVDGIDMTNAQGAFSFHNDKIYIDVNAGLMKGVEMEDVAKYSMLRTFSHEFTHFIEKWNPVEYANFQDLVFETMQKNGTSPDDLIEKRIAENPKLSHDQAKKEVVADAMTDILPEANFIQNLAKKNQNLFQKLHDKLKEFATRIRDYFNSIGMNSSQEAQALKKTVGEAVRYTEDIVQMFDRIAEQAVVRYQASATAQKNTASAGDNVQYEIRNSFYADFDAWDRKDTNKTFIVGTTSDALLSIGMKNQNIALRSGTVLQKVNKHKEMTFDIFKGIPELLEHPIIVQFSDAIDPKTKKPKYDSRITALGELYADGKPVLVSLELLPTNQKKTVVLDFSVITSAYSKAALQQYLNENSILYIEPNKKRTNSWLSLNRLQLPLGENRYGSIRKIAYSDGKIKVESSKNATALQKALEAAGYVDSFGDRLDPDNSAPDASHQKRTSTLTDRDILEIAEKNSITDGLTAGQKSSLKLFNKKQAELKETLKQKSEQEKILKELDKSGRKKSQEATRARNRIEILNGQIGRKSAELQMYEAMDSVKEILKSVKPNVEKQLVEARKEELKKYRTLPKGEKTVRDDSLPSSTDGLNKVSLTARTVKGAQATPNDFVGLIDKEVYLENGLTYISVTNNETVQKATERITQQGWTAARYQWSADVHAGRTGAEMSAMGALLLNNAARAGDKEAWLDILHDYQLMGTNTAQGLQALRILKKLQPEDKLYMIRRSIRQMVDDMHLDTQITIDDRLAEEYQNAKTDRDRDAVLKKITKSVASQIPATWMEKWTALRYVNMLGNLRTQVRNIVGNLGMKAVVSLKNTVASGLEQLAYTASGGKLNRTKSMFVSSDMMKSAREDFEIVRSVILGGGKYSDTRSESSEFTKEVYEQRNIFKFIPLEGYRKVTNWAMESGDLIFSRSAYARALAGYLKAHGVNDSDYSQVDPSVMDEARLYAIQEAQEATFRDTNWLSGWLSKIGRREDTPAMGKVLAEGIMPFRKTPANVLIRAEEYSPLGFINSIVTSVRAMHKDSPVTGAQVINSWAKTLTGTGIFALGMLLQNLGLLVGGADEDDNLDQFESLNGWQNYALILPDGTNLTIDFLSPMAMPLFMGAQVMKLMDDSGIELKELEGALLSIADPMIQMSMLQGVNDTLENIQYTEDNLGQLLVNACVSYLTQGLTNTLMGQLERSLEAERMTTYIDKDSSLPNWLQRALGKASAKTPGWDYSQIPYINAWGEVEENPGVGANAAYNLLSPSYIDKGITDVVTEELTRLNSAQSDVNVLPQTPDKSISYEDKNGVTHENYNLSAEEYIALATAQGKMQRQLVEDIIGSAYYDSLSNEDKANAIQYAYKYARESARIEVIDDYSGFSSQWMAEIEGDVAEAILRKVATGTTDKYTGLDIDSAAHVTKLLQSITPETGYTNVRDIQKLETVVSDKRLSNSEKESVLLDIMGDSLEQKYTSAKNMGISAAAFVDAYRMYLDTSGSGKKQNVIAGFTRSLGLSDDKAKELYRLFSGAK